MPLIECPECYKDVSDKAAACPNCGHPIAGHDPTAAERARMLLASQSTEDDVENGKKHGGRGFFMFVMLIAVGLVILIANTNPPSGGSSQPTCKSDYRLCANNADLINNYEEMLSAKAACQIAAKKLAKYGDPKFPWVPFGTFYGPKDNSYVKTGIVLIEEPEAQFQNGFGAMVHSTVTCRYDLNSKQVVSANVSAN